MRAVRLFGTGGSGVGYASALLVTLAVIVILQFVPAVTARAAVPVLLVTVLLIARTWGTKSALVASATATLAYGSVFARTTATLSLGREERWVALVSFAAGSVIVGELAARAERRSREAAEGQRQISHLYHQLEAAFDHATELEAGRQSDQVKAGLLDAVTHNLRTPLTSIKAAVTALLGRGHWDTEHGLTLEQRRELLQVIEEESDRLNRFVAGLSHDAGPMPVPSGQRAASLSKMVQAALSRATALTRRHRVTVALDPDVPALAVDEAAMVEVLYILLDNATKYSPAGSQVMVSASLESTTHAYVEVADEGPGIGPLLRERVFERFFRIEGRESPDENRRGVGLGLSIARRLVELQGGRIWIETPAHGQGTAVIMMLPLAKGKRDRASPSTADGGPQAER